MMFLSQLCQCCRSAAVAQEESYMAAPATAAVAAAAAAIDSQSLLAFSRSGPPGLRRSRTGGSERWRPALSAISENAAVVFHGIESNRPTAKISAGKSKAKSPSFCQRVKKAWNSAREVGVALPALAPAPFLF